MRKSYVFLLTLLMTLVVGTLSATLLLEDNFTGTVGTLLTDNGWVAHSGAGTTPMSIAEPGLVYSGYVGSGIGNATSASGNNEDVHKSFTAVSSGDVYYSFLINTAITTTTAGYSIHLNGTETGYFNARFWIKLVSGNVNFGISKNSTAPVYDATNYALNTTYLVIVRYTFNTGGAQDDAVSMWINPTLGGAEPTPLVTVTEATADYSSLGFISIRQWNTGTLARFDGIRVGTTWEDVTGSTTVVAPTVQASNITFSNVAQNMMDVNWTNGDGEKRVVIMNTSNSFTAPTDGTDPTADPVYAGGEQVVYNGAGSSVTVTGLDALTTYWFRVYEYNGAGTSTLYLTTTATGNPNSQQTAAPSPLLSVNPSTLWGFTYVENFGPSANQTFAVSGINLTNNISITASTNYEISIDGTTFTSPLTLTPIGGTVAETMIYVRLTAGLPIATYNGEIINVTSTDAVPLTVTCNGSVTGPVPTATVLLRPTHIDISAATAESAVKVNLSNYTTDDVRYRLYNGIYQYNCWDEVTNLYVTSLSYSDGPAAPGTPTTSSTFWIMSQRGGNLSTAASYRDRLGPDYPSNNLTVALPAATEITAPFTLTGVYYGTLTYPLTNKYVVLAYSGTTLISAGSTTLSTGAVSVVCPTGTTIDLIEIRDYLDNLVESKTGSWTTTTDVGVFGIVYTGQIIVVPATLSPFSTVVGTPSAEQSYQLSGIDLISDFIDITVTGPFQIADALAMNWDTELHLLSAGTYDILVRYVPTAEGTHTGTITHSVLDEEAAPVYIELSGTATSPLPSLTVAPETMTFSTNSGTTSAAQSATITSANLTLPIDIALAAAGPFTFSATEGGTYTSTLQLAANYNGTFWIKFSPTAIDTYNNTITLQSGTVSAQIAVTGYGLDPNATYATDLFFSEYIEGSSNNKALEIFNGTGAAVDLSQYSVKLGSNGAAFGTTLVLSGTISNNDVYVIANASANAAILAQADITSTVTYYNGDDAVGLFKNDVLIDVIGVEGVDPGTAWNVAGVTNATAEHTLIRKPTIESPTTDWTLSAGTNAEDSQWIVNAQDYVEDIGIHTFTPGVAIAAAPIIQPAEGLYPSPINVTMSTSTIGGVIWYTLDNTEPTNAAPSIQYTGQFQITATTTVKAKTFADGFLPSVTASAHYIVPLDVATIAELRNGIAGEYYRYTGVGVLTFQQTFRHQKYIQDATAGILIDDLAGKITTLYNLYDGLTGIVGTVTEFGGMKQFTPYGDPGAPYSTGNIVIPQVITLSELVTNFENYESELVKVTDITFDTADGILTFANGQMYPMNTGTMNFRTTFYDVDYIGTVVPLGTWNIIGIPNSRVTEGNLFTARFLSDFEVAGALDTPVATIFLENGSVKLSWAAVTGATGYKVYASNDPYATFPGGWTLLTPTPITALTYTYTGTENFKFFMVTANN
ncbi:MAG: chitobiase/beta-hexosaminidase C-terminal domain-containing protein [Candidatus Cloacimonadaceae bacterium]